ncbi:MAG: metallophosphoesterase [Terrisporobacter sp.]|uniref:metallophosphoesterase n=1 Tax=Terrisporobacter sp. TaxID=1965305 RepID=UPI00399F1C38
MKRKKIILSILVLIILYIFIDINISQNFLLIRRYEVQSDKIENDIKIVQLTDLHCKTFGENNKNLIKKIKEQNPDIITITGDMINSDTSNFDELILLIKKLKNICQVYFSLGNHEDTNENINDIIKNIESSGAVVLESNYKDIIVNRNNIRIGGIYEYLISNMDKEKLSYSFAKKFNNTNNFKILLSHVPDSYVLWDGFKVINPDLVIAGHYHGGLIRIPFVGGLFAPEQGYFPKFDCGKYNINGHDVIISSGLGTNSIIPRINNRPEISVITLTKSDNS